MCRFFHRIKCIGYTSVSTTSPRRPVYQALIGGTCFAKIDVPAAYLPMEADEEFKNLFTINTHKGLIQFNCFSFGIKIALEIFQQTIDAMLKGMTGVTAYINETSLSQVQNPRGTPPMFNLCA